MEAEVARMAEAVAKIIPAVVAEVHRAHHLTDVVARHVVVHHAVAMVVVAAGAEHPIAVAVAHQVAQEDRPGAGSLQCQKMKSGALPAKAAERRMEVAVVQGLHHAAGGKYSRTYFKK